MTLTTATIGTVAELVLEPTGLTCSACAANLAACSCSIEDLREATRCAELRLLDGRRPSSPRRR